MDSCPVRVSAEKMLEHGDLKFVILVMTLAAQVQYVSLRITDAAPSHLKTLRCRVHNNNFFEDALYGAKSARVQQPAQGHYRGPTGVHVKISGSKSPMQFCLQFSCTFQMRLRGGELDSRAQGLNADRVDEEGLREVDDDEDDSFHPVDSANALDAASVLINWDDKPALSAAMLALESGIISCVRCTQAPISNDIPRNRTNSNPNYRALAAFLPAGLHAALPAGLRAALLVLLAALLALPASSPLLLRLLRVLHDNKDAAHESFAAITQAQRTKRSCGGSINNVNK